MAEKNRKKTNQPFFLYLPTNTPHVPEIVGDKYSIQYRSKSMKGTELLMILMEDANIDKNLEELDEFLKKEG